MIVTDTYKYTTATAPGNWINKQQTNHRLVAYDDIQAENR